MLHIQSIHRVDDERTHYDFIDRIAKCTCTPLTNVAKCTMYAKQTDRQKKKMPIFVEKRQWSVNV